MLIASYIEMSPKVPQGLGQTCIFIYLCCDVFICVVLSVSLLEALSSGAWLELPGMLLLLGCAAHGRGGPAEMRKLGVQTFREQNEGE